MKQAIQYGIIFALFLAAFLVFAHRARAEPDEGNEYSITQKQEREEADAAWDDLDRKENKDFNKKPPAQLRAQPRTVIKSRLPAKYFKGKMIDGVCACQCKNPKPPKERAATATLNPYTNAR